MDSHSFDAHRAKMYAEAYVNDQRRQVTLLVPEPLGPAEGLAAARGLLGRADVGLSAANAAPGAVYATYRAGAGYGG